MAEVLPHLQSLAAESPEERRLETGDIQNPGPWLEACSEGVGSRWSWRSQDSFHSMVSTLRAAISLGDGKPRSPSPTLP